MNYQKRLEPKSKALIPLTFVGILIGISSLLLTFSFKNYTKPLDMDADGLQKIPNPSPGLYLASQPICVQEETDYSTDTT